MMIDHKDVGRSSAAEDINRLQGCHSGILAEKYWLTTRMLHFYHTVENVGRLQGRLLAILVKIHCRPQGRHFTIWWKNISWPQGCFRPSCWKYWLSTRMLGRSSCWKCWSTTKISLTTLLKMLVNHKDVTRPPCWKYWSTTRMFCSTICESVSTTRMFVDHRAEITDWLQRCHLTILLKMLVTQEYLPSILWKNIDRLQACHLTILRKMLVTQGHLSIILRKILVDLQACHLTILLKILIDHKDVTRPPWWKPWSSTGCFVGHLAENIGRLQGCHFSISVKYGWP